MPGLLPLRRALFSLGICALLTACATPQVARGINDPFEERNRKVFKQSVAIDKAVLRPVATAYGQAVPDRVQQGVNNFSRNFALPGYVVNDILQADLDDAIHNATRFLMNTTIGLLGVVDFAGSAGLHARDSDFGETLHVWGAPEGAFLFLPVVGPSTERDAVGKVVDLFSNPLGYVLPKPERYLGPATAVASRVGDRYRFTTTVDSISYESADGYAQARVLYLERRRSALGGFQDAEANDDFDPYADPYGQ